MMEGQDEVVDISVNVDFNLEFSEDQEDFSNHFIGEPDPSWPVQENHQEPPVNAQYYSPQPVVNPHNPQPRVNQIRRPNPPTRVNQQQPSPQRRVNPPQTYPQPPINQPQPQQYPQPRRYQPQPNPQPPPNRQQPVHQRQPNPQPRVYPPPEPINPQPQPNRQQPVHQRQPNPQPSVYPPPEPISPQPQSNRQQPVHQRQPNPQPPVYPPPEPTNPQPQPNRQPPVAQPGQATWSTDLFTCLDDVPLWCMATWCPWIVHGWIAEFVNKGTSPSSAYVARYLFGMMLPGTQFMQSGSTRSKMRLQYKIPGNSIEDILTHMFCEGCALHQEYKELTAKGFDVPLGWHANINIARQTQDQGVAMAPVAPNGMTR